MEKFNVKFVGEVEKHPVLYNNTLNEYSRKDYTEKAWREIAKEVNLSVGECKEKWRNLRSTFVKNLKLKPSGSAAGKKKPYYLTNAMQFAVPFVKVAGTPNTNLPEIPDDMPFSSSIMSEDAMTDVQQDSEDSFPEPQKNQHCPDAPRLFHQSEERVDRKRKSRNISSEPDNAFSEYFNAKKMAEMSSEDDEKREGIKHFLNSLVPDLMKMDDVQLRRYKRKTLDNIDEIMGTSPEVYHPGTFVEAPRSSLPSPAQSNLPLLTDSSGCLYVKTDPSGFSPEDV